MGNLVKALKIAIVAGSVLIELAEKYGGRLGKKKSATGKVEAVDAAVTEN